MATFKTRLQDLAGTIPATADAEQFLKDGVVDVVHRVIAAHPQHMPLFAKEESVSSSGTSIHDVHILEVTRDSTICREIPATGRHAAADSSSIHYASTDDPVYYFLNEKIFVLPSGGTKTMSILEHGDISNWDGGVSGTEASSVNYMPSHHYHQVVMYAAIQLLEHKISTLSDEEDVEMMASMSQQLQLLQQKYVASFMATGQ